MILSKLGICELVVNEVLMMKDAAGEIGVVGIGVDPLCVRSYRIKLG